VEELRRLGAELPPLEPLEGLAAANAAIAEKFGAAVQ
jgi:hydroxymethylglutaryl-CoA lyase